MHRATSRASDALPAGRRPPAEPQGPAQLERLVGLARGGDPDAFERLFAHFQPQLYHLAYHHLGDQDDAMDACQDTALNAWRAVRRFDGDLGGFRRWLIRIVVNASLDRTRHEARRPSAPLYVERDGVQHPLPMPDPTQGPEDYALTGDLRALLEACLARLTSDHRAVVLLDQAGLTYAEMAEVLETEPGTVKSRLSRARARLRDLLTSTLPDMAEPGGAVRRSKGDALPSAEESAPAPCPGGESARHATGPP